MSNQSYTELKTAMLLHVTFFASLLLDIMDVRVGKFPDRFPPGNETAATDGRRIWFDEDFLAANKVEENVFVCCHEIGHAMWEHMPRAKYYDSCGFDGQKFRPEVWNMAGDYVINDMLIKSGIGKFPERPDPANPGQMKRVGLLDPKYTCEMSVDEVYRELMKQNKGKGPTDPSEGRFDEHVMDGTEGISSAEMRRAVQTALDTAKSCGKLPAALERMATQFLEVKVKWQELLRTTLVTTASRDTTEWARPHRRRLAQQHIYLPRRAGFGCRLICVFVDTSGSIGEQELNVFFSELADIIRTCRPETVWVLGVDSAIASQEELPPDVDITATPLRLGGGGGTDFNPPFEWVEKKGLEPDAAVYFTDMMGPFPKNAPSYPVIWCATTDTKAPWGTTIHVDVT